MRIILDGNMKTKLATILSKNEIHDGLNFYSEDDDGLQVGTWRYKKHKRLADHKHKRIEKKTLRTQELIYVIQGALMAFIYTERAELMKTVVLQAGDILICWAGGHGYEIMQDDTIVLEVKNGPFLGADIDKEILE